MMATSGGAMKTVVARVSGMITVTFPDGSTRRVRTARDAAQIHRLWGGRKGVGDDRGVTNLVLEWRGFRLTEIPDGWRGGRRGVGKPQGGPETAPWASGPADREDAP